MTPVVTVEDVWKSYRAYEERASTLKETILKRRSRYHEFWALKGVSLTVDEGEMLGVIGANGSGKSTLLKCLARIIAPNYGRIAVRGKVSALLELGTGFHQELTGRENVFLAGTTLGQTRQQVAARFDDIVAFSGLGPFIDSPVKNYSSGMYARLAFAVAIHVDPEVLLIDEVLAVGDEEFQHRCYERLYEFRRDGVPIVFVSHALDVVRNMCTRVAWIDKGEVVMVGDPHAVVDAYIEKVRRDQEGDPAALARLGTRYGNRDIEITAVEFLDAAGTPRSVFAPGEPMVLRFRIASKVQRDDVILAFSVHREGGGDLTGINTLTHGLSPLKVDEGPAWVDYRVDVLPYWRGSYRINAILHDLSGATTFDCRQQEFGFAVGTGGLGHGEGLVYLPGSWDLDGLRGMGG
jgi:ABC-type polysaccharide/polyol phosphate transport system ATPase subunit